MIDTRSVLLTLAVLAVLGVLSICVVDSDAVPYLVGFVLSPVLAIGIGLALLVQWLEIKGMRRYSGASVDALLEHNRDESVVIVSTRRRALVLVGPPKPEEES